MKIKVISPFYDKEHTDTLFTEGTVLDFDEVRAKDVIARKLAVPYEEKPKPAPKPEPKPAPKAEPKAEPKTDAPKAEAKAEVKEKAEKKDKK